MKIPSSMAVRLSRLSFVFGILGKADRIDSFNTIALLKLMVIPAPG